MNLKTLKTLEFDQILLRLKNFAVSFSAKEKINDLCPVGDLETVKNELDKTKEAYLIKYKYNLNPIVQFDDVEEICEKSRVSALLSPGELLKIGRILRSGRLAKSTIDNTGEDIFLLRQIVDAFLLNTFLEKEIERCILSENEISDNASPALRDIRRKLLLANNKLKEKLMGYTRQSDVSGFLQDNLVTLRGGRYVLPVKSEYRSSVPGLIHDKSQSGSTVFVEPFAIVEMNNEIRSLQISEEAEIEKILSDLSTSVKQNCQSILVMQQCLTTLDMIFAKMNYSVSINGIYPIVGNRGVINLKNARHPLLDKNKVVPVTVSVGDEYRILTITGPNTGGKTVCLKTVGLLVLMVESGIFIPCSEGSEISVFENIFCDIGDEQSIAENLSTFSSHIKNIVNICELISDRSLVLLDELGGGTDPLEGAALARGIIKYIELMRSVGVLTTHYPEIKEYSIASPNILNACMQFDEQTLKPTYKLLLGMPGTSNALKIAKTLGLNDYIIKAAYEAVPDQKKQFEKLLYEAEEIKTRSITEFEEAQKAKYELFEQKAELKRQQDLLNEKLDKINTNAKAEIKRIVAKTVDKAEEIIEEIKENLKKGDEQALLESKKLRNRLADLYYDGENAPIVDYLPIDWKKIKLNDNVYVKTLGVIAKLKSFPNKKGEIEIQMGAIISKVSIDSLSSCPQKKEEKSTITVSKSTPNSPIMPEVRVLGLTVGEAIEEIEPYIFSYRGTPTLLKIVHGKGTGALMRGIHAYLKNSPAVKSFRLGGYGEGDTGVTIVEIK